MNDFDEAHQMPYTVDLVRLAVSASLADGMPLKAEAICEAILDGYQDGLKAGGRPFVLAEDHPWLRDVANKNLADPETFWKKSGKKWMPCPARKKKCR